jgi:hypothetical protein
MRLDDIMDIISEHTDDDTTATIREALTRAASCRTTADFPRSDNYPSPEQGNKDLDYSSNPSLLLFFGGQWQCLTPDQYQAIKRLIVTIAMTNGVQPDPYGNYPPTPSYGLNPDFSDEFDMEFTGPIK